MDKKTLQLAFLAFVFIALIFVSGCSKTGGNQDAKTDEITFSMPSELPGGKVGVPYAYSFCNPAPKSLTDSCGGINPTINPSGGKGPYTFYLGSGTGFPPFGITLNINGILAGTPTAKGERTFEVCVKDIGGDFACDTTTLKIKQDEGSGDLTGKWELTSSSVMNGPEGSFPPGCSMEQKLNLDIVQSGNKLSGTATNRLTKTANCGIWSVDIQTPQVTPISGTAADSNVKFTMGQTDFTGKFASVNMSGQVETCHSPDLRCTGSGIKQVNWYSGEFTATRIK